MSSRQMLLALIATFSLVVPRLAHAAELKLAYVDLQRAFAEVDEGRTAKAKLEQIRAAKQKDIDKEKDQLQKEKETYEKQLPTMSAETRAQQGSELQKKFLDLEQRFEKGRAELAQNERETLGGILAKMQPIISGIAQRDGFTMVFEKNDSGLVYAPPSLDLTNELIRLFNEKSKAAATAGSKKSDPASGTAGSKKSDTPKK
jgi:outer membrane protein